MEITDIKIRLCESRGRMRAVASVVFDGAFAVHDMKIIEGEGRLFLAMPAKKTPDGRYRDIVHPISAEMREKLERAVLAAYSAAGEGAESLR